MSLGQLVNILKQQIEILKKVEAYELRRRKAVLKAEANELQFINKEVTSLLLRIKELEQERLDFIENNYANLGFTNLKQLLNYEKERNEGDLDSMTKVDKLREIASSYVNLSEKVRLLLFENERLMKSTNLYIKETLSTLQSNARKNSYARSYSSSNIYKAKTEKNIDSQVIKVNI